MLETTARSSLRTVGTKDLFVEEIGAGTPVVLVHGLGGTTNFYQPLVETLAAGHRVVRYDFNGHGRSPLSPPVCQRALAIDLVALIESLDAGPVHLVAHSMGTLVAQLVAATRPDLVDRLVLLGAVRAQPEPAREATRARATLVREHGMSAVADLIPSVATAEAAASANPLVRPFIREMLLAQTPEGYAQACEALASALNPDLTRITSPTLLITGEQDKVGTPAVSRSIAEEIPEAQVQLLPGVGHWTVTEAPTEVATLLAAFLTPTTTNHSEH